MGDAAKLAWLRHDLLRSLPIGSNVLDIGCGALHDRVVWLERGFRVTAVDPSRDALDRGLAYVPQACKRDCELSQQCASYYPSVFVLNSQAPECMTELHGTYDLAMCAFSLNHCRSTELVRASLRGLRQVALRSLGVYSWNLLEKKMLDWGII